jgi:hypothetical protein
MGVVMCLGMLFRFHLIGMLGAAFITAGPGIFFSLLALPYFGLVPVIILLAAEGYNLIHYPVVKLGIEKDHEK